MEGRYGVKIQGLKRFMGKFVASHHAQSLALPHSFPISIAQYPPPHSLACRDRDDWVQVYWARADDVKVSMLGGNFKVLQGLKSGRLFQSIVRT